ncbi:MAG: hypothetical protein L6R38_005030 [Xanthoria sp. 2 TBL-2021]|nr:MAG: hypothetical protein L6R38_005030 [Xanthoria sp. 2 TBL-2021]
MAKRKAPPRASKKDPYNLDQLLTSDKSKLIDIELHGMLADFFSEPGNWAQVSAEDKEFIRNLLPPHVELTDDGSIPNDFWKYNPEFRLDCRNLQEDLRAGRMDPEWQTQAQQAMEERATGAFDNFKEREFEEYWGQKQKVDWKYLAGDASKIKLEELLNAGLFRQGDIWSFDHTFGRGDEAVTIQKECKVYSSQTPCVTSTDYLKIMNIDGKTVTFAIPPGQLKFARRFDQTTASEDDQATTPPQSTIPESTANTVDGDIVMGEPLSAIESSQVASQPTSLPDRSKGLDQDGNPGVGTATAEGEIKPAVVAQHDNQASTQTTSPEKDPEPNIPTTPTTPNHTPMKSSIEKSSQKSSPLSEIEDTTPTTIDHGVVHFTISTLWSLEKKIIEIDSRLPSSTRTASAWRDIRCRRNEQDMGSLFEMRDEYYAYQVAGRDQNLRRGKRS